MYMGCHWLPWKNIKRSEQKQFKTETTKHSVLGPQWCPGFVFQVSCYFSTVLESMALSLCSVVSVQLIWYTQWMSSMLTLNFCFLIRHWVDSRWWGSLSKKQRTKGGFCNLQMVFPDWGTRWEWNTQENNERDLNNNRKKLVYIILREIFICWWWC